MKLELPKSYFYRFLNRIFSVLLQEVFSAFKETTDQLDASVISISRAPVFNATHYFFDLISNIYKSDMIHTSVSLDAQSCVKVLDIRLKPVKHLVRR